MVYAVVPPAPEALVSMNEPPPAIVVTVIEMSERLVRLRRDRRFSRGSSSLSSSYSSSSLMMPSSWSFDLSSLSSALASSTVYSSVPVSCIRWDEGDSPARELR